MSDDNSHSNTENANEVCSPINALDLNYTQELPNKQPKLLTDCPSDQEFDPTSLIKEKEVTSINCRISEQMNAMLPDKGRMQGPTERPP